MNAGKHELIRYSIQVVLQNQADSGAYIASPNFPMYRYCWFRDGAYSAYAMSLVGERDSAARFHAWAAERVNERAGLIRQAIQKVAAGEPLSAGEYLHTRYTLDGQDEDGSNWPNFQLDGFGAWLWALEEHYRLFEEPVPEPVLRSAGLVADYLEALWHQPCYDCWEEHPDFVHPHTLAAIFGGLRAHSQWGCDHAATLAAIRQMITERFTLNGSFVKLPGSPAVDASLIGLCIPYGVFSWNDPHMKGTIEAIEQTLRRGGGVHRYAADTYYGGGEWLLLTAWLGWYYLEAGETGKARALARWIESQAGRDAASPYSLPEQTPDNLNDPDMLQPWVERWGPVASPLLWSHANYLILDHYLKSSQNRQ